jgi:hypothetical protein
MTVVARRITRSGICAEWSDGLDGVEDAISS